MMHLFSFSKDYFLQTFQSLPVQGFNLIYYCYAVGPQIFYHASFVATTNLNVGEDMLWLPIKY